jgi:hypothetical protein
LYSYTNNLLAGSHQKRLLEKLFRNHNVLERPVENESDTLTVSLGLAIQQIVNVVSISQLFFFIKYKNFISIFNSLG